MVSCNNSATDLRAGWIRDITCAIVEVLLDLLKEVHVGNLYEALVRRRVFLVVEDERQRVLVAGRALVLAVLEVLPLDRLCRVKISLISVPIVFVQVVLPIKDQLYRRGAGARQTKPVVAVLDLRPGEPCLLTLVQ